MQSEGKRKKRGSEKYYTQSTIRIENQQPEGTFGYKPS